MCARSVMANHFEPNTWVEVGRVTPVIEFLLRHSQVDNELSTGC
jgi:hypothetical protein